jgi:5-formyltetrahydrofolate cyclo-ligase
LEGSLSKQELREKIWTALQRNRVARFPGAKGRIPNFVGAERCANQVAALDVWSGARVIKSNPDSPQRAIRHLALKQGKIIYMAVPRLREEKCFVELDPEHIGSNLYAASSIAGAFKFGRQVAIDKMKPIDLILCGSVAVGRSGMRVGKGGGYSDLEYGLAVEMGIVTHKTPVLTTVHPLQIVEEKVPLKPHDIPVDYIVTPDETIATKTRLARPRGIYWEYLDEDKIAAIPLLKRLARRATRTR